MGLIIRPGRKGRFPGVAGTRACTVQSAFGRASDFSPAAISGLTAWYRGDLGVTLGATPLASGTVPPVVALSGSLAQSLGLYIQIDGAGALGVATFKWSINNGSTFVATAVLTGASIVLGSTGITAAFAAGAYLTDNIYQATVASWADQSGTGATLLQATAANQPLLIAAAKNNRPGLRADGVNDRMTVSGGQLGPLGQPEDVFLPAIWTNAFAATDSLFDGPSTNRMRLFRNADTSLSIFGGAALNAGSLSSVLSWHTYRLSFNGATNSTISQDNILQATGNAGTAGATGLTLFDLGGGAQNTAATIPEFLIYTRILTALEATRLQAYFKTRYAL